MKYRIWSKNAECYTNEPEYPGSSLHCTSNYYLDHNGNLVDFVTSLYFHFSEQQIVPKKFKNLTPKNQK